MLAIIPEDSKSGAQFWMAMNRELLGDRALILDRFKDSTSALGFTTILPRLEKAIEEKRISAGWNVLVAIDNIGTVSVLSQIELIKKLCIENNIKLFVTTYYCIEEVFLSFEFFHKWVKNINKEYLILLHYVAECIRSRKNYFSFHSDCEAEFKKVLDRCKKEKNREQFAAQLLSLVTHNNSGFKISKDQLGPC